MDNNSANEMEQVKQQLTEIKDQLDRIENYQKQERIRRWIYVGVIALIIIALAIVVVPKVVTLYRNYQSVMAEVEKVEKAIDDLNLERITEAVNTVSEIDFEKVKATVEQIEDINFEKVKGTIEQIEQIDFATVANAVDRIKTFAESLNMGSLFR